MVEHDRGIEHARTRLLYDDTAPRFRKPVNPSVLKFRRPGILFLPVTVLVAAAVPTAMATGALFPAMSLGPEPVAAAFGSFFVLAVLMGLGLSRREEQSFALLLPNLLSASHLLLLVALGVAFFGAGPQGNATIQQLVDGFPGPAMGTTTLNLLKAYCVLFALITVASVAAALVMRLIGFRRVVAGNV